MNAHKTGRKQLGVETEQGGTVHILLRDSASEVMTAMNRGER
jgi:hypothetical protein